MAITANTIISRALERIRVKDPRDEIDADDAATGIQYLNDMMLAFAEHDGIDLNYTIVSSIDDEITTPDWSHGMMWSTLALWLADEYGKDVTLGLSALADRLQTGVRRKTVKIGKAVLPDGLPTGQGNAAYNTRYGGTGNFFHDHTCNDATDDLGNSLTDENGTALDDGDCHTGRDILKP